MLAAFFIDAITAVIGVGLLALVPVARVIRADTGKVSYFGDLRAGLKYASTHPQVRWILVLFTLVMVMVCRDAAVDGRLRPARGTVLGRVPAHPRRSAALHRGGRHPCHPSARRSLAAVDRTKEEPVTPAAVAPEEEARQSTKCDVSSLSEMTVARHLEGTGQQTKLWGSAAGNQLDGHTETRGDDGGDDQLLDHGNS
ncbi:hypothetical protein [Nocardioides sp. NPDC006273]|uniref:hypothetical protein n=1 Tax=Nocardioides sp. NPDC006273 TaxID=3155598 RepID=UPI0033B3ADE1